MDAQFKLLLELYVSARHPLNRMMAGAALYRALKKHGFHDLARELPF